MFASRITMELSSPPLELEVPVESQRSNKMDNSGRGPLRVPGFGGIPVQYELWPEDRFAHALAEWRQPSLIPRGELPMVRAINAMTDHAGWPLLDSDALAHWQEQIRPRYESVTERVSEWCLRELQDMAAHYNRTGFVQVLDTGCVACKADGLLPPGLISDLASLTQPLFTKAKSLQLESDEVVIVDPHMYPLIYGRTLVLQDGGSTSLESFNDTSRARTAERKIDEDYGLLDNHDDALSRIRVGRARTKLWNYSKSRPGWDMYDNGRYLDYFYSPNFQCLPCDVEATNTNSGVRIVSYINNLHPQRFSAIYRRLECLISAAIEPWSSCLMKGQWPSAGPTLDGHDVRLQDHLHSTGLQIIVKIWGVELTPDKSSSKSEDWHLQGTLNEHVAATATLAFDAKYVVFPYMKFRQETAMVGQDDCCWRHDFMHQPTTFDHGRVARQPIGAIEMRPGRLITFPNVMEHYLNAVWLKDPSRDGHIRFVSLWLVDPHYRICSTRNTPAQQHDWWWAEAVIMTLQLTGLPLEICEVIVGFCPDSPVEVEQARLNRERLREELQLLQIVHDSLRDVSNS